MCPKPTQPEEIDLILMEMKIRGMMNDTHNLEKGLSGGNVQGQFEGASRSSDRDAYLTMRTSNKSGDKQ